MKKDPLPVTAFRAWLVRRLASTRWARYSEPGREKWAPRLGLQPELLHEAHAFVAEEAKRRGLQPPLGRKAAGTPHRQLMIHLPPDHWRAWHDWAEGRGLKSSAALRALVHSYLLGSWEPRWRNKHWPPLDGPDGPLQTAKDDAYREKALLPHGAHEALRRRAARLNIAPRTLVRGLIVAALGGYVQNVAPVDSRAMPDDPDLYPMPPDDE